MELIINKDKSILSGQLQCNLFLMRIILVLFFLIAVLLNVWKIQDDKNSGKYQSEKQ